MNALRRFVLILCLAAPCCTAAGLAFAAQPAQAQQAQTKNAAKPAQKPVVRKAPAKKAKPRSKAVAKPLPKAKLDLSLPTDLVDNLEPDVGTPSPIQRRKPLLPPMFRDKPEADDSPFQLNGRLINNEMQLQLRNDSRREVEGAAIDFEFRQ
ncbi:MULTISPECIES: hypothetical protein [Pseudomonas]|uniref:Translation initiation factor 2 n=1 Tax=Pseudomonas juntendi TaxID=2666183 RepID=A0A7W2LSQ2_9PSED|nr:MULTISPECIES: hypothetical protein [Pseudomonas]NOY01587.1 hypothetical protein [Gammaproteobacteria bacterium]QOH70278.1 hypothetical protein IGB31_22400 [Pseudomonas putida]MBA6131136.1 hypothetical protein [Pseudomonas juntendi]MBA6146340.1 hypothetical protein [Pseudomonas juntendi]MCK2109475.1 hypothetical protein [Pseudomonas juntendi]